VTRFETESAGVYFDLRTLVVGNAPVQRIERSVGADVAGEHHRGGEREVFDPPHRDHAVCCEEEQDEETRDGTSHATSVWVATAHARAAQLSPARR
jgi:hypothetical protein